MNNFVIIPMIFVNSKHTNFTKHESLLSSWKSLSWERNSLPFMDTFTGEDYIL
jgi:hypothetical protein